MTIYPPSLSDTSMFVPLLRLLAGSKQPRQAVNATSPAFSLVSDVGVVRDENQDRAIAAQVGSTAAGATSFICLAVSDGMGGMFDGEQCAILTLSAFTAALVASNARNPMERLEFAARSADRAVHSFARGQGGATLSAVLVERSGRSWALNVGDSRIYVVAGGQRQVQRVTVDDTLAEAFGGESRDLVQFIGIGEALRPHVSELPNTADQVLITSDGAHFFDKQLFEQIILLAGDPKRAADRLIALSRWLGGPDNATVAAFRIGDLASAEPADPQSVRVWTPNEVTNFVMLGPPQQVYSPSVRNVEAAEPASPQSKSNRKRSNKRRGDAKYVGSPDKTSQPELLITVSEDTPTDDPHS